jgi:hypothetical protein
MADELKNVDFKQFGKEYPGAEAIRAVRNKDTAFLTTSRTTSTPPLGAETTFAALPAKEGGDWRSIASVRQIVPAHPAWDAAADSGNRWQIVYEEAGGAVNALVIRALSGETRGLTGAYPMQSFSLPRFAKTFRELSLWVTAVLDNRICVALPLAQAGPYTELGECAEGLLVKDGLGFVFLSKMRTPGKVRGNSIAPGKLQARRFGANLQPVGEPTEALRGTIFQFDAVVAEGKLVIVATTSDGIVVASTSVGSLQFKTQEYRAPSALSYPTLLPVSAESVIIYLLDAEESVKARILGSEMAIP